MENNIFLPDPEQIGKLIEDAWVDFCEKARKSGYDIGDDTANGWLKDTFCAGYSYGHNNILGIIRDQFAVMELGNNMFKEGEGRKDDNLNDRQT